MELDEITGGILSFARENTVLAVVAAAVILYFAYKKPKLFLGILSLGLFLAGAFYLIMSMADSGKINKERMIHKDEKTIENL